MRRKGRNVRGWVAAVNDDEGARGGAFGDDDEERGSARGGRSRGGGVDEDGDDEVEAPLRRRGWRDVCMATYDCSRCQTNSPMTR